MGLRWCETRTGEGYKMEPVPMSPVTFVYRNHMIDGDRNFDHPTGCPRMSEMQIRGSSHIAGKG